MSDQLLGILKFAFLALLYLFFARVLWAVWSEVRGPRLGRVPVQMQQQASTLDAQRPVVVQQRKVRMGKRGAVGRLVVLQPKERKGASFSIVGEITVGRAPHCTISMPDDTFVSQLHARLFQGEGETWVEDLGSTNGSHLNGARLTGAAVIAKGDRLQIGSTVLEAQ